MLLIYQQHLLFIIIDTTKHILDLISICGKKEPGDLPGTDHAFDVNQTDEHGVYFEMDLTTEYPTATLLGIIIKQGGWDGYREPGGDRFINLETIEVIGGVAHAYFVEGDVRIGMSNSDLENNIPDYRAKILSAAFNQTQQIVLKNNAYPN